MTKDLEKKGTEMLLGEWQEAKKEFISNIDSLIEKGSTSKETLEIMKELLIESKITRKKKSIEEYFEELEKK